MLCGAKQVFRIEVCSMNVDITIEYGSCFRCLKFKTDLMFLLYSVYRQ